MAKATSDPKMAAALVDAAAALKDQADELPPSAPEAKTEAMKRRPYNPATTLFPQ
jgi:hypothetical protein